MKDVSKVLLYSPDPNLAKALGLLLRQAGGFELLPPCMHIAGVRPAIECGAPDLVLLDLNSELTLAAIAQIKRETAVELVLWANTVSPEIALRAIELGIRGILRKSLPADLHIRCLKVVQSGGSWFEKALFDRDIPVAPIELTAAENRLVQLLTQGLKNKEIACELRLTETQVRADLSRLFCKVGVKDRFEMALYGVKAQTARRPSAEEALAAMDTKIEAIA